MSEEADQVRASPPWGTPESWDDMASFLDYFRGWTFEQKTYRRWRDGWEHDHCRSCGQTIMEPGAWNQAISVAYAVGDEHPNGAEYEWLCPPCALGLAPRLDLRLVDA